MFNPDFDAIIDADFEPALNKLYAVANWYNKLKWKGIIQSWTAILNEENRKKNLIEKRLSEITNIFIKLIESDDANIITLMRNAENIENNMLKEYLLKLNTDCKDALKFDNGKLKKE